MALRGGLSPVDNLRAQAWVAIYWVHVRFGGVLLWRITERMGQQSLSTAPGKCLFKFFFREFHSILFINSLKHFETSSSSGIGLYANADSSV